MHLFYDTFGYPFYNTFLWALGVMIPRWGWLVIGLLLGLFVASVITSIRNAFLVRELKSLWSWPVAYPTILDYVRAAKTHLRDRAAHLEALFGDWKSKYSAHVAGLETRVATLTDERSRLQAQLDKFYKRPRDSKGHFIKEAKAKSK